MRTAPSLVVIACLGLGSACKSGDSGATGGLDDPLGYEPVDASYGVAERAVVVVLDGVRMDESFGDGESDAWGGPTEEVLPRIRDDLRSRGGVAEPAYVSGTTFTGSSHASLLTGVRQYYANLGASTGYGLRQPDLPTFFELLRLERGIGPKQAVFAANTKILGDLTRSRAPGFGLDYGATYHRVTAAASENKDAQRDASVLTRVRSSLTGDGAVFALANLHQIDRAGHASAQDYADYVSDVDSPVVELWNWMLREQDQAGLPLTFVLSDHGRHRISSDESPWQDHGCACSGCREVPLLALGPGIEPGSVVTQPTLLEDVTHTMAWLMGVPMPYSTGLALDELLAGEPDIPVRSGEVAVAAHGELIAWQRWEPRHAARSSVLVDGEVVATGVLHAEAPAVVRGEDADFACWRQLDLDLSQDSWPWEAHCAQRLAGGAWRDLGAETVELPDGFEAQLGVDDKGRLWVLYLGGELDNGLGAITPSTVGYGLARWDPSLDAWDQTSRLQAQGRFPSHARLLMEEGRNWVVMAVSDDQTSMRYSRHLEIYELGWNTDGVPVWIELASLYGPDSELDAVGRLERPAIGRAGDVLTTVAVGYADTGTYLMAATLDESSGFAREWTELSQLDDSGLVYPHLSPAFSDDGWVYWARQAGSGGVEICRADDAAEPSCRDSGYGWIDSLAPADGGAWVSVSDGDLAWSRVWVPF